MIRDITTADLEELILIYLNRRGVSPDYAAGYLDAQRKSGYLKPTAPAWIRNSAALWYCLPPADYATAPADYATEPAFNEEAPAEDANDPESLKHAPENFEL